MNILPLILRQKVRASSLQIQCCISIKHAISYLQVPSVTQVQKDHNSLQVSPKNHSKKNPKKIMRNKQPSVSISPLFLSTFLAFLFINESQARFSQPYDCSSSCGDIKNINYPFRLSSQPLNCGDPDYTLSCKNNKTILESESGKYYVKTINYEQQIIRIVDVNLANGNCSLPTQTAYSWDFIGVGYWGVANLMNTEIAFVKCTRNISDAFYFKVHCMSQNNSITYAVYNNGDMNLPQLSCEPPLAVTFAVDEHDTGKPSSYEDIQRILQAGFDLGWSVECRDCVKSGRVCDFNRDPKPSYKCHKPCKKAIIHLFHYGLMVLI